MTERANTVLGRTLAVLAGLHVEIGLLVFCGIIFLGTGRTNGPVFDVVGPDLLPTVTASIVATLVTLQILMQVLRASRSPPPPLRADPLALRNLFLFTFATAFFVYSIAYGWLPFALATSVFITFNTMLLSNRLHWRDAAIGAASGLALGLVLKFMFTRVLFIDLPG